MGVEDGGTMSATLQLLQALLRLLVEQVAVAQTSLILAAANRPIYPTLHCIRYILEGVDFRWLFCFLVEERELGGGGAKRGYGKGFYFIFLEAGSKDSCRINLKQILEKNNLSFVAADINIWFLLRGGSSGGEGVFFLILFLRGRREWGCSPRNLPWKEWRKEKAVTLWHWMIEKDFIPFYLEWGEERGLGWPWSYSLKSATSSLRLE